MMSHVSLALSNQGRPFLEVVLPSKAINIMSVFVAGQAVRPTIQKDKLFIPIERTLQNEKINVEFVYTHSVKFPKNSGDVSIESPKFNVPLQSIAWQLRVPRDYKYTDFKGTVSLDESRRVANLTFSETLYTTKKPCIGLVCQGSLHNISMKPIHYKSHPTHRLYIWFLCLKRYR